MQLVMDLAGAGVPSPNRVVLLRDSNGDGTADFRTNYIEGLNSPFGLALIGKTLYVANADSLVAFPYREGQDRIQASPDKIVDLPGGPLNHHWTKSLIASEDGRFLYVGVGSNSNVAENGMDLEKNRAAILQVDIERRSIRPFATGLRNPVGMAWEPQTKALWTVVNERDELGSDLVPDYLTSVKEGGFYGWPYSYYGTHVDERVLPQRPDLVAQAISRRRRMARRVRLRGIHCPARLLEPEPAVWLQSRISGLRRRPAKRRPSRCFNGLPQR
jgi:glucose/arabinose dehydrogenase